MDLKILYPEALIRAFEQCERGSKGHCILSNIVRECARYVGRKVRYVQTYDGFLHWSEEIDGEWGQYIAPIPPKFAAKIDGFDHEKKHFNAPKYCPLGQPQFVKDCEPPRHDAPEVVRGRKERLYARIAEGKMKPGEKFRQRQLPIVLAREKSE